MMQNTYSVRALQRGTAAAVKRAEKGDTVTITRHDQPVAVIMGHERAAAIAETLEILGDPAALAAIQADRAGKGRLYTLDDLT